jgi:MoaA/NifB/PqqE/SkfB family radical SAM enzyme
MIAKKFFKTLYKSLTNIVLKRPIYLNIEVTLKCNARCQMCRYWKTEKENALSDFSDIINRLKPLYVTLSGGEPLLRKDLISIISSIKNNCDVLFVSLTTNGALLDVKKALALKEAGLDGIGFSLDFLGEEHDKQRGIKGLYKHLAEIIPEIAKLGFKNVQLHTTISQKNLDHLVKIAEQARIWNVDSSFTAFSYTKVGKSKFWIREEFNQKLQKNINQILRLKYKYGHINNSDYYLKTIPIYFRDGYIPGCKAGTRWMQVTPEGNLKICSEFPVWCHYTEYAHPPPLPNCGKCWFKCRGEAQGMFLPKRILEYLSLFFKKEAFFYKENENWY